MYMHLTVKTHTSEIPYVRRRSTNIHFDRNNIILQEEMRSRIRAARAFDQPSRAWKLKTLFGRVRSTLCTCLERIQKSVHPSISFRASTSWLLFVSLPTSLLSDLEWPESLSDWLSTRVCSSKILRPRVSSFMLLFSMSVMAIRRFMFGGMLVGCCLKILVPIFKAFSTCNEVEHCVNSLQRAVLYFSRYSLRPPVRYPGTCPSCSSWTTCRDYKTASVCGAFSDVYCAVSYELFPWIPQPARTRSSLASAFAIQPRLYEGMEATKLDCIERERGSLGYTYLLTL